MAGRVAKGIGIGCAGLVGLVLLVGIVLVLWKPWAPEIVVADPLDGGTRVTDDGMVANWYPAEEQAQAVLVFGGSEGGLSGGANHVSRALQEEGLSALAISYWGAEGQRPRMEHIPLETFETAMAWLGRQEGVDGDAIGVVGASKGGEAAVLLASRYPQVAATVGYTPSNVVWAGIDLAEVWRQFLGMGSTWSHGGQELPYLPYSDEYRGGDLVDLYSLSLQDLPHHQDAIIQVENAAGPLMLVCGEADTMWPGCDMARAVESRAEQNGGPEVTVLAYPDAGHMVYGPPVSPDIPFYEVMGQYGGTPESNNAAAADSWPQVVAFLRENLDS